ncbi:MAG: HipA N-terminal domain-containing protein [Lentisphaerales bacterium]|nr:HipA N-terminal domain-containing protein [Lentisphaerales bacterium]
MRKVEVSLHGIPAGYLTEKGKGEYTFEYLSEYNGSPISMTLPIRSTPYTYQNLPSFFEGLLPEGAQLDFLLKSKKIDEDDYFSQLVCIGDDFVGAVSIVEVFE